MRIVFRPSARRDVLLQVAYFIDQDALDAAEAFPSAVERALAQIQQNPDIGSPRRQGAKDRSKTRAYKISYFAR